jgi:cation diffusion facilitator family transporter
MFSTTGGAVKLSLIVVIGLTVLKVAVAVITGSISIFAQAADSFFDLFAVTVTLFAVRIAAKPADKEHPFGHGKVEDIAAIFQAGLILAVGGLIIYSAIRRIITGVTLELTEAGIGVMLVSIIASIFLSRHLLKVSKDTGSTALEANARNITTDVYSAVGVLVGLAAVRFTGFSILDPIVALVVALVILKTAYDILRKSFGGLIDVRLPQVEEDEIRTCIMACGDEIAGFHKLRTRRAGNQRFIEFHLIMPKNVSVEEAHRVTDHLERDIENKLKHTSVTIHIEPYNTECE